MVAIFAQGSSLVLLDLWSKNHDTPREDTALGGSQDYSISHWDNSNGNLTAVLTRKLDTGDLYDFTIKQDLEMSICWGYLAKPQFTLHSDYGSGKIRWGLTPVTATYKATSSSLSTHQSLMSFLWLFLIQLSIILPRYFKTFSRWFLLHSLIGVVTIAASYASMAAMFQEDQLTSYSEDTLVHSRLGMVMMAVMVGEGLLGVMVRYLSMFSQNLSVLFIARRAHNFLGYTLVGVGFCACWYGEKLGSPSSNPPDELLAFIVWIALFLFADFLYQLGHSRIPLLKGCFRKRTVMTHAEVIEKVTKEGKKWAFWDQYVLDLSHFANPHPGGAVVVGETYGEDYGKYVSGTNGYGTMVAGYAHSPKAYIYLHRLIIGKLPSSISYFKDASPGYKWTDWRYEESIELAPNTRIFSFIHSEYTVAETFPSLECLGKHVSVRAVINGTVVTRYYSISAALLRLSAKAPIKPGHLLLLVKSYPPHGIMSTYLFNRKNGDKLEVKGPLGPGLALSPTLDGLCLAIGAGTGIMPFLDLAGVMLQQKRQEVGPYPADQLNAGMSLVMYCGFRKKEDNFAAEFLENVGIAFKDEPKPRLRIILAYDENKEDKLSPAMLSRHLNSESVSRAWVCGPAGFNKYALDSLLAVGVARGTVMLM